MKSLFVGALLALSVPFAASSASIGIGDFVAPAIEEFETFGPNASISAPLVLNGVTYTSDDGDLIAWSDTAIYPN